jgi:hypothetical protein
MNRWASSSLAFLIQVNLPAYLAIQAENASRSKQQYRNSAYDAAYNS